MTGILDWLKQRGRPRHRGPRFPVNLLIELRSFDKGGLEKVVLDTARHLDRDRFRPVIVSVGKAGRLARTARDHGLCVYDLSRFNRRRPFERILKKERIDLANSHFSEYGYRFFTRLRIPNVTFIHNVYAFLTSDDQERMRRYDPAIRRYVAVSRNAARYAVEKIGLPRDKFTVIANGLDIDEYEARSRAAKPIDKTELGIGKDDYVFLNVASYNLHKGHYLMAAAMKRILTRRRDVRIVCIGDVVHRPHLEQFKRYLAREGLRDHILLPGYFPNVESFYLMADAFLLASFIEGWSIAMNEAMFFAKPMILTATGGAPEVIENDDIGILIPNEYGDILNLDSPSLDTMAFDHREFKTSEPLAEAMLQLADHPGYWRTAGEKGRQKLLRRYRLDQVVDRYQQVFIDALGPVDQAPGTRSCGDQTQDDSMV